MPKSTVGARPKADIERQLLEEQAPSFSAWHVKEPELLFAAGNRSVDPKTGLARFGPVDVGQHPVLRIGIIGTGKTVDDAQKWIDRCKSSIEPPLKALPKGGYKAVDPVLFPSFPGFRPDTLFRSEICVSHTDVFTQDEVTRIANIPEFSQRVKAAVDTLISRLESLKDSESPPNVVIAAMPEEIEKACRTGARDSVTPLTLEQRRNLGRIRRLEAAGHTFLFDMKPTLGIEESEDAGHQNFRRYLKARAMAVGIPTQLVWPGTFEGLTRQDVATTSWNLIVGLYYKAGGIPWRVVGLEPGTVYVGVSFYRERGPDPSIRTSLAQAFSEHTDGIVLRGDPFRWDELNRGKQPHLEKAAAQGLLSQVLKVYEQKTRQKPRRVVIHKTSFYTPDELEGFKGALDGIHFSDFVALRNSDIRLLRLGNEPLVRGTAIHLGGSRFLLYTRGFVPYLRAYPGLRIPSPLEIHQHFGTGSIRKVCEEIMALTKMNWNTADFACSDPITMAFSRRVGEILAEMDRGQQPEASYRFYM